MSTCLSVKSRAEGGFSNAPILDSRACLCEAAKPGFRRTEYSHETRASSHRRQLGSRLSHLDLRCLHLLQLRSGTIAISLLVTSGKRHDWRDTYEIGTLRSSPSAFVTWINQRTAISSLTVTCVGGARLTSRDG